MPFNTKEKRALYQKDYNLQNKKKIAARHKAYYLQNREMLAACHKAYNFKHKEKRAVYGKEYHLKHRERLVAYHKDYYLQNKEKMSAYQSVYNKVYARTRRGTDIQFRLTRNLRSRLYKAIRSGYKSGSAVRDLGCTIDELKIHLEKQFLPRMTWDNWSRDGWHIDHNVPLDFFDLDDRKQLLQACHYTNLQPMWAEENIRKSNKIMI